MNRGDSETPLDQRTKNMKYMLIPKDDQSSVVEVRLGELVRSIATGQLAPRPSVDKIGAWHQCVWEHSVRVNSLLVLRQNSENDGLSGIRGRIYQDPFTSRQIVRCDNSPPIWIYNRACHGEAPESTFQDLLDSRRFDMA